METLLSSSLTEKFELIVLDTADRRGLTNVGQFDLNNLLLALKHGIQFLQFLLFRHPDIIYVSISQGTLGYLRDCLFLVPARMARRKAVVHLHGSDLKAFYGRSSFLMKGLIRWTLGRVCRAVVLGENLRDRFFGLVPPHRIAVVPNGIKPAVDTTEIEPGAGEGRNDVFRVVYLGTVKKAKGFMDLLKAIPKVVAEDSDVRFVLAGEHCYADEMREAEEYIKSKNISHFVEMPGPLIGKDKMRLLAEGDIFVFPPRRPEGQPLVILEAMSAGLPVISTPMGAIPETVIDGVTGFLVPPGEPERLAEKILQLMKDHRLRKDMGAAGQRRFSEHYTVERWADAMAVVFHEVLATKVG